MDRGLNETEVYRRHFAGSEPTAQHLTESSAKLIYLVIETIILEKTFISLYVDYPVTFSDTDDLETPLERKREKFFLYIFLCPQYQPFLGPHQAQQSDLCCTVLFLLICYRVVDIFYYLKEIKYNTISEVQCILDQVILVWTGLLLPVTNFKYYLLFY